MSPVRRRLNTTIAALTVVVLPACPYPSAGLAHAQATMSRLDEICIVMDREASAGIALTIFCASQGGERAASEVLARLHRAREHCRRGWVDFARVDYEALRRAFPLAGHRAHAFARQPDAAPSLTAWAASSEGCVR